MTPFTLTREQVRELDRRAIDGFGVPGVVLMENAGRGCAELLMRLNPDRKPTVILCGPGNNGGDGFVIARHLDNHGWPVWVVNVQGEPRREDGNGKPEFPPDAETNWRIVARTKLDSWPECRDVDPRSEAAIQGRILTLGDRWLVDALFGTGLSRPLGTPFDQIVERMNASGSPILAIDIPSGLDCDTGEPLGPTVRATHTATFVAPKRGFLNPKSREWTGEVHVIDIGAPRVLVEEYRARPG
jgi:NAD(P)H-hydrate epimerase